MPAAIPAIVGAVAYYGATQAAFGAVAAATIALVASLASSMIVQSMTKPKSRDIPNVAAAPIDRSQTVRQTDSPREYVYGRNKKAGTLLFQYCTTDNKYYYMILGFASHSINSWESVHIGEDSIAWASWDADNTYTSTGITHKQPRTDSKYYQYLWCDFSYGTNTGVNTRFQNEINQDAGSTILTGFDQFQGMACLYIKLRWNPDLYQSIPNIQATLLGKNTVYDTRDTTYKYSTNPALCLYDYFTDTLIGLGAAASEIDTSAVSTAANVCDESVSLNGGGSESRYTCNGVISADAKIADGVEAFLTSMAGRLVYVNGTFRMLAGAYITPTITLTEDDFVEELQVSRYGKRDKFNAVKGIYIAEDNNWQPADFPYVTNSTYQTEDGERLYKEVQYTFISSSPTAQRVATLDLAFNRQDIIVATTISPRQWNIAAGDTVMITYSPFGWTSKVFEVQERTFKIVSDKNNTPLFGIGLILKETSSGVYTWTNNETIVTDAPDTNLPDPFTVDVPTLTSLDSTETWLIRGKDGKIINRIRLTWADTGNEFVKVGGRIELEYKKSSSSEWLQHGYVNGDQLAGFITDVDDRETYDVRIRAVSAVGSKSLYSTSSNHIVVGKTTPPPNVTGFEASEALGLVRFSWDSMSILDVYGYEIRYGYDGIAWKDAIPLTIAYQGTNETSASIPPGTWTFLIKAVDTVGLYSNAASAAGPITVSNANLILQAVDDGQFPGTLSNFVRHYTGVLVPDDQYNADYYGWETFDQCVPTPYQICTYTSSEVDLGSNQNVRVWGDVQSRLCPGVTTGVAKPELQIKYRSASDSSSGSDTSSSLVTSSGTFSNCILHYTGVVVPDSQSLASVDTWDIFDEFVYNPYENCYYESVEQDLGSNQNTIITLTAGQQLGPGETGTPESNLYIKTRVSGGTYDDYVTYSAGTFNLRYYTTKVTWSNISNVTYLAQLLTDTSGWRKWIIGSVNGVRYVQARIRLDTDIGVAEITDFNWTIDQ